jgi:hypothetical protein
MRERIKILLQELTNEVVFKILLQELIQEVILEQEYLEDHIKNGKVEELATNAEILNLAKNLISDISRNKRIKEMLEDIMSLTHTNANEEPLKKDGK